MIQRNNVPVYLRALEIDDLEATHRWHNDEELYRSLGGQFRPVSRVAEQRWLESVVVWSADQISFAICESTSSLHIGNLYLKKIDLASKRAELHLFIGEPDARGRGAGKAAMKLAIEYAFGTMALRRICLEVLASNEAAIHLYEECGFVEEGRLRHHVIKDGIAGDVLVMGLNREDGD